MARLYSLAHTAASVAEQEGQTAQLIGASARPWLIAVVAAASLGAAGALTAEAAPAFLIGSLVAWAALILAGPFAVEPRTTLAILVVWVLVVAAVCTGLESLVVGAGLIAASSFGLAEIVAALALRRGNPAWAAPGSLIVPALVGTVCAYSLPASWASTWGCLVGAAVAIVLSVLARLGEHAAGFRHGPRQTAAAALSRAVEAGRSAWLALAGEPH